MLKRFLMLCCFALLTSCKCQKEAEIDAPNEVRVISSEKIRTLLREKNFDVMVNAEVVIAYDIKKKLLEGTTDEYSNKVVLKDTLDALKAEQLLSLLKDDSSYDWKRTIDTVPFEPNKQFLIKDELNRLILLIDEKKQIMGFINFDGQTLIPYSKLLSFFANNK